MRRFIQLAAPLAALLLMLSGCTAVLGGGGREVSATFDDVIDLVPRGSVRMNDIIVGQIQSVELTDDHRAMVTMSIDDGAPVPSNVRAVLAKTSVLGERYVALEVVGDPVGQLEDGMVIADTAERTDLEDLVESGSTLLDVVVPNSVRVAIETFAETFGGREQLLTGFVDDVSGMLSTYNDNSDDLLALIDSLDAVTGAYAPNAERNAAVLADLRAAAASLQQLDDQLLDTLDDATVLSTEATDFLTRHQDELNNTVRRVRELLDQVVLAEDEVRLWLKLLPRQFLWVPRASVDNDVAVWLDVIICGVNEPKDPPDNSRDCTPENAGRADDPVDAYPVPEECWDDPEPCTGEPEDS